MGFSARIAPKGASDETLAQMSIKEKRVIVTNDEDFSEYPKSTVFSVVWLRIPQNDPQGAYLACNSYNSFLADSLDPLLAPLL